MMIRSTKMLVVLAVLLSIVCTLPCAAQYSRNAKDDLKNNMLLQTSGMLLNPNGDWSYGWATNADPFSNYTFNPFTGFGTNRGEHMNTNPPPLTLSNKIWCVWSSRSAYNGAEVPAIYFNNTSTTLVSDNVPSNAWNTVAFSLGIADFPAQELMLVSGYKGTSTQPSRHKAIIRWTAPGTGTYTVNASFKNRFDSDGVGCDADVHVIKNCTEHLMDGMVGSTTTDGPVTETADYHDSINLNAGDTLDFAVGHGTTYLSSNRQGLAGLELTISSTESEVTVSGTAPAGAKITAAGGCRATIADSSGNFSIVLMPGANTLTVSKPGYVTQSFAVTAPSTDNNFTLAEAGRVTGTVTWNGLPVNMAKISVIGGNDYVFTGSDGVYSLPLPTGNYNLRASRVGFANLDQNGISVTNGDTTVQNFEISMNPGASWPANTGLNRLNPNPHDSWTYGWAPDSTQTGYTFTASTELFLCRQSSWGYLDTCVAATGGPDCWNSAWINPAGIVQHPGNNNKSVVRFTAPVEGWYTIDAHWASMGAGLVDYSVVVNNSTVLMEGRDSVGTSPVLHTGVELPQGGTIDFCIGDNGNGNTNDWARLNAVVSYGVSGVTGWVKDSNGNPIEGARVQAGEDATTTNANGEYVLPTTTTGELTVIVTKPTYETDTQTVTVNTGVLTTHNVTLVDSGYFIGHVLANPAPGIPMAGVTMTSSDGVYSITTGADGSFSVHITSGTYKFKVYKYGFLPKFVEVTIPAEGLDLDIMMTKGWDLAGDFSSTTSQNGAWTLGYDNGTFVRMTEFRNGWGAPNTHSWIGSATTIGAAGAWVYNPTWMELGKDHVYRAVRESMKVITHPARQFPASNNTAYAGRKTVARFVAPADGYYDVNITWSGLTDHDTAFQYNHGTGVTPQFVNSVDRTTSEVEFMMNGVSVKKDQLNGFAGTPSKGYTDEFGDNPVISHSQTQTLEAGYVLDVIVSGDNCGWTGVDFRVSAAEDAAYVLGRVTASVPGNPALAGATVTIAGPKTYEVTTDADGYYLVPVEPGSYTVTAFIDGYTSGNLNTGALVSGGSATLNFSLTASGLAYINGKVTTGGAPLAGATVTVVGAQTYTVTTDANGDYVVLVAPGSYTVTASAEGYQSYTVTADNLTAGNGATRNLSIWLIEDSAHLSGTVRWTNREGNPVVEAKIVAEGGYPNYQTFETYSDASGHYELVLEPGTEYEIVASRPGTKNKADSFALEVSAGETITHDFGLEFGGVWDAADDYSSVYNPIGEWSYGWTSLSSERAEFGLYTQVTGVIGGEKLNYKFWTTAGGGMWNGGVRKNPNSVMSIFENIYGEYQQTWYSEPNQLVMFPGGQTSQGHDRLSIVRWTAPKNMVVDVYARWSSQWAPGYVSPDNGLHQYPFKPVVAKNGTIISAPILRGFAGRGEANFTDAFGLAGRNPVETFATPIAVNAGDTVDFSFADNNLQQYLIGLEAKIEEYKGQYAMVNSISEIKAQEDGTVVFLLTPMQLACGTYHSSARQEGCFEYQYGTAQPEVSWFIQTDDRTQGIKCIVPAGGLPSLDADNKVTLTGVVDTDEYGEKVILVGSINSYTASAKPAPLGKTLKSLTNTGTLVRVWGRITHLEPNPNPVINPDNGTKDFVYEYITLNDGSNAVKVLLHVQGEMISDFDEWVRNLSVGDYLGVTGIAYTIGNGEVVVMPRTSTDINFYADN